MSEVAVPGALASLARLRRPAPAAGERCELCGEDIGDEHRHVVDLHDRGLLCTCRPCGLLFTRPGAGGGRYRAVPERYARVVDFALSAEQWEALQIPVAVAFFFHNSSLGARSAFFPGPAGATECLLPLDVWADVEAANPVLATLEPDTEALLVRAGGSGAGGSGAGEGVAAPAGGAFLGQSVVPGTDLIHFPPDLPQERRFAPRTSPGAPSSGAGAGFECFVVPIDACYELVGHLRARWRGFDGGQEAHEQMAAFFAGLRERARPLTRAGADG